MKGKNDPTAFLAQLKVFSCAAPVIWLLLLLVVVVVVAALALM